MCVRFVAALKFYNYSERYNRLCDRPETAPLAIWAAIKAALKLFAFPHLKFYYCLHYYYFFFLPQLRSALRPINETLHTHMGHRLQPLN